MQLSVHRTEWSFIFITRQSVTYPVNCANTWRSSFIGRTAIRNGAIIFAALAHMSRCVLKLTTIPSEARYPQKGIRELVENRLTDKPPSLVLGPAASDLCIGLYEALS